MQTETSRDIYSISRLNSELRAVLENSFPLLWVEGEISNLATPRSGHLYFNMKDDHAQIRCALFRNKRQLLRFKPADGDKVLARARVALYEPRGDCQLIVEHLEPAGAGDAQRRFEELKRKLQQEGLFDTAGKRALPGFPQRLGVITSASGAAIRDVLHVLARRFPALSVTIFPSAVQGAQAPAELRAALQRAIERNDCDVLLLTRGGGSIEDLAAFNDEQLARDVAASPIPVVSAVGHEIDFTITDFVADRRAPTPSAAAELISPDQDALLARLASYQNQLRSRIIRSLSTAGTHYDKLEQRLRRSHPGRRLQQHQQRLDELDNRMQQAFHRSLAMQHNALRQMELRLQGVHPGNHVSDLANQTENLRRRMQYAWTARLERKKSRLSELARALQAVSPLATLERGYTITLDSSGKALTSCKPLAPETPFTLKFVDGTVDALVQKVSIDEQV